MTRAAFDTHMMAIALMMARRGLGFTAPNPSVGAVIADEATGEVIARGVTAPGGRPHAETQAIAEAGERARGKTIYVTLEPCSHVGKTGPCAEAIVTAGLKRAVVASKIRSPRRRTRPRPPESRRHRGCSRHRRRRSPLDHARSHRPCDRTPAARHVETGTRSPRNVPRGDGGVPQFVTSPQARAHGHLLRAKADAILVGSGTVRDDNPDSPAGLPGLEASSPLRAVLSRGLDIDRRPGCSTAPAGFPCCVLHGSGWISNVRRRLQRKASRWPK